MVVMINTARDKRVWAVLNGNIPPRFPSNIIRATQRRLIALDAAMTIDELRSPPSNRLEALSGSRKGEYSIRINRQWRICFRWVKNNAEDVEIVDYH